MIVKTAIIKKLKNGKYRLYSRKKDKGGKRRNLGTYNSLAAAKKREKAIQYFKHHVEDGVVDDKQTKMLGELSDIAAYLEEAGFIDKSNLCYDIMAAIDGSLAADDDYDGKRKLYLPTKETFEIDPRSYKSYEGEERYMYTLKNGKKVNVRDQLNPIEAKEIIRNIARVGNVRYSKIHLLEQQLRRQIDMSEIYEALGHGKVCQPEQEGGSWRYKVETPIGGGFYLIVRIENNRTIAVLTAFETEIRRRMRQIGRSPRRR